MQGTRSLAVWSWLVVVLLAAHDVTHVIDDGLETGLGELAIVAIPQWIVVALLMAVILRGDATRSPAAALVLGLGVTAGFALVHLLPLSSAAFWELEPSTLSWVLAWVPTAAGLVLAASAAACLRWRRSPRR